MCLRVESPKGFWGESLADKTQFEVETSISDTKRRQRTMTIGCLVRDREIKDIVAPKLYNYETLCVML